MKSLGLIIPLLFALKLQAWSLTGGRSPASEECENATKLIRALADKYAFEKPRVILIGEFHKTLSPDNYVELIKKIIPNRTGTCLAVELSPKQAKQLQGFYLDAAIAKPLGMRTLFIDSAVTTMVEDESLSLSGLNKRDMRMNENIRANLGSCRQIVSINGAIHTTHVLDSQHGIKSAARITLTDLLGNLARVIVVTKAAEACGLVPDDKERNGAQ